MKLEVKKTVTEEIEVEFPFYTKLKFYTFKHVSQMECIAIFLGANMYAYEYHNFTVPEWLCAERATEDEFEAAKAEFIRRMNETHD